MRGTPESVTIEVIEKLLVTQVTARALSAQEIRDKGIVFDKSNFQAYNFTAAFAVQDTPIQISFPVVLPTLQGAQDVTLSQAGLGHDPGADPAGAEDDHPRHAEAADPDSRTSRSSASRSRCRRLAGKQLVVPPIPGVVVIPGDIGFLNQFFSVMLLVGNVAPAGSNLVVTDLTGEILLPAGNDTVVGSDDDPLRMAQTTSGPSPKIQLVVQPGADGKLGTADDIASLGPGDSGSAEYLVEGRREGTHVIEFNITGTLHGLPVGPVQVTGRAAGSVLVRNPSFTLTFTHPDTVAAGEHYSLDVTVTNTSDSPANFVSVNLFSQNVSGAAVVGDPSRQIESIPPSDSATVSFDLVSRVTGKSDRRHARHGREGCRPLLAEDGGRRARRAGLARLADPAVRSERRCRRICAAPCSGCSARRGRWRRRRRRRCRRTSRASRSRSSSTARFRRPKPACGSACTSRCPTARRSSRWTSSAATSARLAALHPDPADLQFAQARLRRLRRAPAPLGPRRRPRVGGRRAARADIASQGTVAFHQAFAEKMSYRPPHLSVLVTSDAGPLPFTVTLVDAQGRRVGREDAGGKIVKEIPYSDLAAVRQRQRARRPVR